jgi:DNA polymerase-3 subunit beta
VTEPTPTAPEPSKAVATTRSRKRKDPAPPAAEGMQMTAELNDFKDAVTWAGRGLPSHPTAPILGGISIEVNAEGTEAQIHTFDYEVSAQAAMPLTSGTSGRILVSGRLLVEIAKSLPPHPVQITTDGTRAELTCGSAHFTLLLLPVEEYPTLPDLPDPAGSIGAAALAAAVTQVSHAAGRDDTLPALTGIRIEFSDSTIRWVATDRYRLAVGETTAAAWTPSRGFAEMVPCLVPGAVLLDAARGMAGAETVEIYLGDGIVGLSGDGRRLTSRMIAAEYPKYAQLLPDEFAATATVPAAPIIEAVKRVALVLERNTPVRLKFSDGQLLLEAGSGDAASATEAITGSEDHPVTYEGTGDEWLILFNPEYLLDAVTPLAGGDVRFQFTGPAKPAVIAGADGTVPGYLTVLVPVRSAG